jgi:hypothetical protein
LEEPLPDAIAAGVADVSARGGWNVAAPASHALPTEIWRETVARRQRATQLIERMRSGALRQSNDLITENLDVRLFLADVIAHADVTRVVTLWQRLQTLSVLDPTVGSGAFLFAALNILMPVYDACIDRLGVLRSDNALAPHTQVVAAVLHDLQAHKSQTYTVLKRIMVNNLYGVDIMEEAVEICKLRLFLKLTAQISELAQLEPLPDIDFNIRAGNTLVGYARLKDANNIVLNTTKQMDLNDTEDELKKQLEALSATVAEYRAAATQQGTTYEEKVKLSAQFGATAEVLNLRLAELYKVDVKDAHSYEAWKKSHEPFHWCSEFYEIVEERGGFDVIVGNPPYVGYPKVKNDYQVLAYRTEKSANLYAFVIERCLNLVTLNSWFGYIVPIASVSTDGMKSLQKLYHSYTLWHSNFAVRPGKLFNGVDMNLTISILKVANQAKTFTSPYYRWSASKDADKDGRQFLMDSVSYSSSIQISNDMIAVPKTDEVGITILAKLGNLKRKIKDLPGNKSVYYHSGGRYWRKANLRQLSSHYKEVNVSQQVHEFVYVLLNSSLFYWYWIVFSNCMDVVSREVDEFRVPNQTFIPQGIATKLTEFYESSGVSRIRTGEIIHTTEVNYKMKDAKHIIDEIDRVLARHYGFTDEELDYIINYDIKYRMGLVGGDAADEDGE